jgi:PHD/YefM family antitoxin component YafN of YafNO toxin-antitoxin module
MIITHQTVIGDNGKPSAVIIPWDVFQKVREMLEGEPTPEEAEAMKEAEADRLNGNDDAFTDLDDLKSELSL